LSSYLIRNRAARNTLFTAQRTTHCQIPLPISILRGREMAMRSFPFLVNAPVALVAQGDQVGFAVAASMAAIPKVVDLKVRSCTTDLCGRRRAMRQSVV
jgi:hypothetical protein